MAFYNCNSISSSGVSGGGISSLGKIEEYGYTLSEAKDIFSFDRTFTFKVVGVDNQGIFLYNNNKSSFLKINYDANSLVELNIPYNIMVDTGTGKSAYSFAQQFEKVSFLSNGCIFVYYNTSGYKIFRYNNGEIVNTGIEISSRYTPLVFTDRYFYQKGSSDVYIYNATDHNFKASIRMDGNEGFFIDADDNTFAYYQRQCPEIVKISNYNSTRVRLYPSNKYTADIEYRSVSGIFSAGYYIYFILPSETVRINTKAETISVNPYNTKFINSLCSWMSEHILYDLHAVNNKYVIHKHADIVNKLILYLKEGNEILCDSNILHNITSNLIKNANGYKCITTGKCEFWFREDPEELVYSII